MDTVANRLKLARRTGYLFRWRRVSLASGRSMHEYSLVLSLIERVETEAKQRGAKSIRRVAVSIGELSGVEAELFSSAFEIARSGTLCQATALEVKRTPARWACPRCGSTLDARVSLHCVACDAAGNLVEGGDLLFEQMEIEV